MSNLNNNNKSKKNANGSTNPNGIELMLETLRRTNETTTNSNQPNSKQPNSKPRRKFITHRRKNINHGPSNLNEKQQNIKAMPSLMNMVPSRLLNNIQPHTNAVPSNINTIQQYTNAGSSNMNTIQPYMNAGPSNMNHRISNQLTIKPYSQLTEHNRSAHENSEHNNNNNNGFVFVDKNNTKTRPVHVEPIHETIPENNEIENNALENYVDVRKFNSDYKWFNATKSKNNNWALNSSLKAHKEIMAYGNFNDLLQINETTDLARNLFNNPNYNIELLSSGNTGSAAYIYIFTSKTPTNNQYYSFAVKIGTYNSANSNYSGVIDNINTNKKQYKFDIINMKNNIIFLKGCQQEALIYAYVTEAYRLKITPHFLNYFYFNSKFKNPNKHVDRALKRKYPQNDKTYVLVTETATNKKFKIMSLYDFVLNFAVNLNTNDDNNNLINIALNNILFQIVYTLLCMEEMELLHCDLHIGNILLMIEYNDIDRGETPQFALLNRVRHYIDVSNSENKVNYINYAYGNNSMQYRLIYLGITVKIFDFDRSILRSISFKKSAVFGVISYTGHNNTVIPSIYGKFYKNEEYNEKDFLLPVIDKSYFYDIFRCLIQIKKLLFNSRSFNNYIKATHDFFCDTVVNGELLAEFDKAFNLFNNSNMRLGYTLSYTYDECKNMLLNYPKLPKSDHIFKVNNLIYATTEPYVYVYNSSQQYIGIARITDKIFKSKLELLDSFIKYQNSKFQTPKSSTCIGRYSTKNIATLKQKSVQSPKTTAIQRLTKNNIAQIPTEQ